MPRAALLCLGLLAGCAGEPVETPPPALSPDAAASRGFEALNRGADGAARAYFELALEMDPDNRFARRGMEMVRGDPVAPPAAE